MPADFSNSPHPVELMQLAGDGFCGDELCRQYRLGDRIAWVDAKVGNTGEARALVVPVGITASDCEHFNPLEEHGLVFQFAAVEPTEDGFLQFARTFGFLGVRSVTLAGSVPCVGELWGDWKEAHLALTRAVVIWNDLQGGGEGYERLPSGEVALGVGKGGLMEEINHHLRGATTMRVVWNIGRQAHEFRVIPTTLLGAMWWQLARVFTGEVTYRRCKSCGKYLERGPRDSGSAPRQENAMFCSSTCRKRDHRSKLKAIGLKAGGLAPECIAAELDTDLDTIRRWFAQNR